MARALQIETTPIPSYAVIAVPSVVPEPSIFPPAKPASAHRNAAASDANGADAGEFAKLLDSKPSSDTERPAKAKRNESKSERHNDSTPAKAARRGNGAAQEKQADTHAPDDAAAAETPQQTSADAQTDTGSETVKASSGDATSEINDAAPVSDEKLAEATADVLVAATPAQPAPVAAALAGAGPVDPAVTPQAQGGAANEAASQTTPAIQPFKLRPQVQAPAEASGKDPSSPSQPKQGGEFLELVPQDDAPVRAGNAEQAQRPAAAERAPVAVTKDAATDIAARPNDTTIKTGADLVQNLGITPATQNAPTQSTAAAHAAAAAAPAPSSAVPVAGLAVEIAAQSMAGKNRFEIRLDPPELGRIDVRLEIDNDGNVKSRLIVERAETLDMLRRDAPQLERALQQAGLKTSDNALEFSLRDQAPQRDGEADQNANRLVVPDEDAAPVAAVPHNYGRLLGLGGGLDIRV